MIIRHISNRRTACTAFPSSVTAGPSVVWSDPPRCTHIARTPNTHGIRCGSSGELRAHRGVVASERGGGLLERPGTSTTIPLTSPGEDLRKVRQKKKPRIYKVMLHNDSVNRREYVVRVLMKVIKSLTVDDAVNAMQQAHMYGLACVIACAQDEAEKYCEGLRANGLISTVEPASSGSGGSEPSS